MATVSVSLGSNLGDRLRNLREAVRRLGEYGQVIRVSKVYETAPMYVADQPSYLNAAALFETGLGPLQTLQALKLVEREVGRKESPRYGPREIDLDMIGYGVLRYRFSRGGRDWLVLPHPRAGERRFVLQPLLDLNPEMILPGIGPVKSLLAMTESQAPTVQQLNDALLPVLGN